MGFKTSLVRYFKVILKWWWVIVLLTGVTVGTMGAISFFSEPLYQATVTVQVSAPPPQEVPLFSQFGRDSLSGQIEQTRLGLSELFMAGDVTYMILDKYPELGLNEDELNGKIIVDIPEASQLMNISVLAATPDTAALLANELAAFGLERYGQLQAQPTANTIDFIEQELEAATKDLEASEGELMQFQIESKIGDLNRSINSLNDQIGELRSESDLSRAEGRVERAQAIEQIILLRETEIQNLIGQSARYNQLMDRVERVRSTYNFLLDKLTEAQIKENQILKTGFVQIITPARPPRKPVSLISGNLITLGAVVSLMVGMLLAFLLEYLGLRQQTPQVQPYTEPAESLSLSHHAG